MESLCSIPQINRRFNNISFSPSNWAYFKLVYHCSTGLTSVKLGKGVQSSTHIGFFIWLTDCSTQCTWRRFWFIFDILLARLILTLQNPERPLFYSCWLDMIFVLKETYILNFFYPLFCVSSGQSFFLHFFVFDVADHPCWWELGRWLWHSSCN